MNFKFYILSFFILFFSNCSNEQENKNIINKNELKLLKEQNNSNFFAISKIYGLNIKNSYIYLNNIKLGYFKNQSILKYNKYNSNFIVLENIVNEPIGAIYNPKVIKLLIIFIGLDFDNNYHNSLKFNIEDIEKLENQIDVNNLYLTSKEDLLNIINNIRKERKIKGNINIEKIISNYIDFISKLLHHKWN
jgi:hypothetical protein